MPEIGYWKYVRFTDDEPLYFGTDDDVTVVFDSADDRLEYRMKKDIRFEDDTGAEILTLDKTNRYVKLGTDLKTGGYHIYHGVSNSDDLIIAGGSSVYGSAGAYMQLYGTAHSVRPGQLILVAGIVNNTLAQLILCTADTSPVSRERIVINQGDNPDVDFINCNVDLNNNLLKNTKLGTDLKTNNYHIYDGVTGDTGSLKISGGSSPESDTGSAIYFFGIGHTILPGNLYLMTGKKAGAKMHFRSWNAPLTDVADRIIINQGDDPDIDILNGKLDFHDQAPVTGKVALDEYIEIRVNNTLTRFLRLYA